MVTFLLLLMTVVVTGLITFGLTVFLNSFLEWGMEDGVPAVIGGGGGVVAVFTAMVMFTPRDHASEVWIYLTMMVMPIFLGLLVLLVMFVGTRLMRWASSLGTRANQARADREFHRNVERE
jgi:hypothetical protein